MAEELKAVVDAANLNKIVKDTIANVAPYEVVAAPVIVTHYPNELDKMGNLTCENVAIDPADRMFAESELFLSFFLLNRTSIAPRIYQRWAMLSAIGAMVGRNCYMEEEGRRTYPNMYVALVGDSGAGKSTALDMVKPIMRKAGYVSIADAATTKDKFLLDMHSSFSYSDEKPKTIAAQLDAVMFDEGKVDDSCEGWICCSEWNEYFRTQGNQGNFDFINTILAMYDNPDSMATRSKVGGSVYIRSPTLSIIGGSTINNLLQFAPILSAEPFYSRTCLIYAAGTNQTYQPSATSKPLEDRVVSNLRRIRDMKGEISFEEGGARELFDSIISTQSECRVPDSRLNPYYSRRGLHLRKVCMILAIAENSKKISIHNVMHANSIMTFAESFMQRALAEYGGLRQGIAESVVMNELNSTPFAVSATEIIQRCSHVVENVQKLGEIIGKLTMMGRVGLSPEAKYYSLQKDFRIKSDFASITELYEYH